MFCGNCMRDNTLVAALRRMGHQVLMVPLYLPLTLDEPDQSAGEPVFFSGINVYLEQKVPLFRHAPAWLHRLFASRRVLGWVAGKAGSTHPKDLGDVTLSMLRGEEGFQACELQELIGWLKTQAKPDAILLSNVLLAGMVRRLKAGFSGPIVCSFQGEDVFLDTLPEPYRAACWQTLAERAAEIDRFIAPSRYFGELMGRRLSLPAARVCVVYNGISLDGYPAATPEGRDGESPAAANPPILGYLARMCREKGLDILAEAYLLLRQRERVKGLRLRIGGSCGPSDRPLVESLRERFRTAGVLGEVEFHPNLDRKAKIEFLRSLSVFSVPAIYGEAFGLYVIEAMAAGVPVVQPRTAAFPELIEATGGGVLCPAGDAGALAEAIESLLLRPDHGRALGLAGRQQVFANFNAEAMARRLLESVETVRR
jgi:glycosyltransferase involved in cell wall biosynthesis